MKEKESVHERRHREKAILRSFDEVYYMPEEFHLDYGLEEIRGQELDPFNGTKEEFEEALAYVAAHPFAVNHTRSKAHRKTKASDVTY